MSKPSNDTRVGDCVLKPCDCECFLECPLFPCGDALLWYEAPPVGEEPLLYEAPPCGDLVRGDLLRLGEGCDTSRSGMYCL